MAEDAARVRFPPPLIAVGTTIAGWLLGRYVAPFGLGLEATVARPLALIVGLLGVTLAGWALVLFVRSGQNPEPWTPTPSLVPTGPYRFTRNPMYVGMALVQLAIGLWLGSLWIVALVPLFMVLVFVVAVRPEEAYLAQRFGEQYAVYRAHVRRWL